MNPSNPINHNDPFDVYDVFFNDDRERYVQSYVAYEQFVSLYDQEAGGSQSGEKRTRAYVSLYDQGTWHMKNLYLN